MSSTRIFHGPDQPGYLSGGGGGGGGPAGVFTNNAAAFVPAPAAAGERTIFLRDSIYFDVGPGGDERLLFPKPELVIHNTDLVSNINSATASAFSELTGAIISTNLTPFMTVDLATATFTAVTGGVFVFDGNASWQLKGLDTQIEVPVHFSLIASKTIGQFYYTKMGDLLYKGFQNNILWNIGHVPVTLGLLTYKRCGLELPFSKST